MYAQKVCDLAMRVFKRTPACERFVQIFRVKEWEINETKRENVCPSSFAVSVYAD